MGSKYNIIKNILWKMYGYDINMAIKELNALQNLPKNLYWDNQKRKRDSIFKYHYENTPWYSNHTGNIGQWNWSDIPIVTKRELQNFSSELINKYKYAKGNYIANTSGASGHPFSFLKNKSCHSLAWAKIRTTYADLNILENDKEARFFGHVRGSETTKIYENIKDFLLKRYRFDIFDLSDNKLSDYLNIFKINKFSYVYGYTNVIIEFSKYLMKYNSVPLKNYCPTLKACIVTAEMCIERDRKIIGEALGIPVYREYGSSETSIIAIEDENLNWCLSTDRLWVEILDDNNKPVSFGETGKIVITDLYNNVFPFVRYEIGDFGSVKKSEEYPYLLLKDLYGRISDMIYLPSGKKAPGLTFYYVARSILEKSNNIREFRIIQKSINTFLFKIVAKQDLTHSEKREIIKETERYLEPGLNVNFEICDEIPRCYSGKIQHFFSEIGDSLQ